MSRELPAWATWNPVAAAAPWTIGIEEEAMLLDPATWQLAWRGDDALAALPSGVQAHAAAETHACALELATEPHADLDAAITQLAGLRAGMASALAGLGLAAAGAGTHPRAVWSDVQVSPAARYQYLHATLGELARREPTFGLHVHVAVPDPEQAVRVLDRIRAHLPLLLALSANSPFWQGRDAGLASVRMPLFGGFPRTGLPRRYADYADYVGAVERLVRCGAIPEPTFLWWDARPQPRFGTIEIRAMDAPSRLADTAALTALARSAVRLEALESFAPAALLDAPEVLEENRFLAARDGMDAELVDAVRERRRPARDLLGELLAACRPHAQDLGCAGALDGVAALAEATGADRQRATADRAGGDLDAVVAALQADYAPDPVVTPATV